MVCVVLALASATPQMSGTQVRIDGRTNWAVRDNPMQRRSKYEKPPPFHREIDPRDERDLFRLRRYGEMLEEEIASRQLPEPQRQAKLAHLLEELRGYQAETDARLEQCDRLRQRIEAWSGKPFPPVPRPFLPGWVNVAAREAASKVRMPLW
jgi:hypothetical protein